MTTLYLFDEDQTLIHAIPSKDMIQARQTLEKPDDGELPIDQFTAIYKLEAYKDYESIHYMAVKDLEEDNAFHMYYVTQPIVKGHTVTLEGIQLGYRELKYFINSDIRPNGTARYVMGRVLEGSEWSVGYVSETDNQLNSFYYQPVLESLKEFANAYGLELVFKVEISGQQITDKWVEAYNRRGPRTMKRFTHGENALSIKATIDRSGLYTALIGRGRGEEIEDSDGFGRAIQFADVEWSVANGDPVDKPLGQNYVELPEATDEFGVVMRDGSKAPAMGVFEDDQIEDPAELLRATYNELVQRSRPLVQYQSTVAKMGKAELGETVTVHRYDLDLHYETRIFKLVVDYLNPKRTEVELGDHVVESRQARESRTQRTIANLTRDQQRIREEVSYVVRTADGFNRTTYGNVEPEERRVGDYWVRDHPVHEEHTQSLIWTGDAWELLIDTSLNDEVSQQVEEALEEAQEAKAQVERESEERRADIQAESERLSTEWNERIEENEQIVEGVRHSTEELMNDFDRALTQTGFTTIEDLTTTLNTRSLEAIELAREADGYAIEALDVVNGFGTRITDVESTVEGQATSINTAIATAERVERDLTRVEDVAEGARVVANRVEETAEGFEQSITRIESDLDGKATVAAFNTLESTVDGSIQRIGDAEGNITQMEADIEGITNTVSDYEGRISRTEQRADGLYDVVHDPSEGLLTEVQQIAEGWQVTAQRLDDLSVGGRNYVLNSGIERVIHGRNTSIQVDYWLPVNADFVGQRVTISYDVVSTTSNGTIRLQFSGGVPEWAATDTVALTTTKTRHSDTRTLGSVGGNANNVGVRLDNADGVVTVSNVKIELGNKATDWSPAPEDMASQADITVLHNAIDMAVEEGDVIGRLNIQAGHTLIQNGEILMDADTVRFTGSAFIPNAAIEEVSANKIIGNDGQFNTLRSRFLTSNVIESDHLNVTTAMIDRLFANSALIERLTSQQAFIDQLSASNLEIDGGRVHGTLNGNSLNFVNIDVNSLSGNQTEFVRSYWNNAVGGNVQVTGSGIVTTASDGSQSLVQNGVFLSRNNSGATVGYLGYSQLSGSPWYRLQTTLGANFEIRGLVSGGSNRQMMSFYPQSNEIYMYPSNLYMVGRINAQSGITSSGTLNMNGNTISQISQVNLLHGGYLTALSSNSELRLRASGGRMQIGTSGSWAIVIDNTHTYMHRTLNMQGNSITEQSDERLKSKIEKDTSSKLAFFKQIDLTTFEWTDGRKDYGVIAQQLHSIDPATVDTSTEYLSVNSSLIQKYSWRAIQELAYLEEHTNKLASKNYLKIEELTEWKDEKDKKIEELEARIKELEGAA